MKTLNIIALAAISLLISCTGTNSLKVMSFNIRYDTQRDGDNAWPNRKELVIDFLVEESPDIFGLQEALLHQYEYINSCMPGYSSIATGRSDGKKLGEMTPVFFKTDRFKLLDSETFWLSETPQIPGSKGWGAVLPRIVTWVKLHDLESDTDFYYFNTHYSHISDSARLMSSKILGEQVRKISGNHFFVITGDFNMLPESEAYAALTSRFEYPIADTYLLSETEPVGVKYTFNGFKDVIGSGRIDYIFAKTGTVVTDFQVHNIKSNGIFISDHWPTTARIEIWE